MLTFKGVFEETQLPVWEAEAPLVHIGSLNPADKGMRGDSYEGHGLSVSDCPDAWEAIAKLGGNPWWHFEKSGGVPRFLDWHSVQDSARAEMVAWAVDNGFSVPCIGFRLNWYDDDRGGRVFSTFDDPHSARIEYDSMVLEFEGDEADVPTLDEVEGHMLTPVGLKALARKRADFGEVPELSAILYCEAETELDGVYWGDVLDEEGLSAPRAVIFPHRLAGFHVTPHAIKSELPDPRTVEYTETVEERLEALPRLLQQAGAAYTLYLVASKALQVADGDPMDVDWDQVHQDVFSKAVRQDKQPVAAVLEVIKRNSPGAITPKQIAVVEAISEPRRVSPYTGQPSAVSLTMFHASKHAFDFPDVGLLNANRENHANGALGLWVSKQSDWIKSFGSNLYEVAFTGTVLDLPVGQLAQWGRGHPGDGFFQQHREELLRQGVAYIRVVEIDGRSDMGIVVDFAAIEQFKRLSGSELARQAEGPSPGV